MRMHVRGFVGVTMMVAAVAVEASAATRSPLTEAVKRGDGEAVRQALKSGSSATATEADGMTPLHWATDRNDVETARLLVAAGADVKAKNRYGFTPLYSAAVAGNAAMLELLLRAGADASTELPEGETTLMTAARTGNTAALEVLLSRHVDVNAKERWKHQTALMWAAHEGNTEAVKLLIAHGARISDRSIFGWTPLLFAARQGHIPTIRALVAAGADINETLPDGTSSLVTTIQGLSYEAAAVLLDLGADPNAGGQGWTPLHQVVWSRRPQRGQNNPGQKPQGRLSSLDLASRLIAAGADVNARQTKEPHSDMEGRNGMNRYGATPLLLASKSCDVPMVQRLLELGADPFMTTIEGTSPLMAAAGVGIFSQGESPGEPEESAEAIKIFLALGASATDIDKNGETSLHGPAWRGSNEAVTLLVDAGANLNARNSRGWRPLTIADGVHINARVMMMPHTAKLLRELMTARGIDTTEQDINFGGAMRDRVVLEDQLDAENPSDVQRTMLEQQRQQQDRALELVKKMQANPR